MDILQGSIIQPLQPYLRPIVSVVPKPVHDAAISLIGPSCYDTLILKLDVPANPECVSLAISKVLGLAIVGVSSVVKVPQILKLVESGSSAGVSFVSYALETAGLLINVSYNVRNHSPFSTYGESCMIAIQDVVVGVLVLTLANNLAAAGTFVGVFATSVYALLYNQTLVDAQMMTYLQAGATALGLASKAPQIYAIWREGGTGQLSAFAVSTVILYRGEGCAIADLSFFQVFSYLIGSMTRIFTTKREVHNDLLLYNVIANSILNLILAGQMIYYWKSPTTTAAESKSTKKKAPGGQPQVVIPITPTTAKKSKAESTGAAKKPTTRRRG